VSIKTLKKISVDQFLEDVKDRYDLINNSQVADHFGISKASVSQWKMLNHVPMKYLLKFYKENINPFQNDPSKFRLPDDAVVMPAEKGLIPVVGLAQAGPGIFSEEDYPAGVADEYISRPHGITDPQAFGIIIIDDSMNPAYYHHQRVLCSPNVEIHVRARCVIGLKSGERIVACIKKMTDENIYFTKYNADDFTLKREDIDFIYKIVWTKEL
jgi:phage repressor protein C with HTH and peptisase S24 domain